MVEDNKDILEFQDRDKPENRNNPELPQQEFKTSFYFNGSSDEAQEIREKM